MSDHADLLETADWMVEHRVRGPVNCHEYVDAIADLAEALRATLAQRDEAHARVTDLTRDVEALEALVSDVRSTMAEAWDRGDSTVPLDDLALILGGPLSPAWEINHRSDPARPVSPPTAGDDQP